MKEVSEKDILNLQDAWWRANNLYFIRPKGQSRVLFQPNWAQRTIRRIKAKQRVRMMAIPKGRQLGISTDSVIDSLDDCLFRKQGNLKAGVIDLKIEDGVKKVEMARFAYESLDAPWHPQRHLGALIKRDVDLIKKNTTELAWNNGSNFKTAMSFVGDTRQRLHVSDAGKIAFQDPQRSAEILESFESVPAQGTILAEGVHYGGKSGWFYEVCKAGLAAPSEGMLSPAQWKMLFLEWWKHPEYRLADEFCDESSLNEEMRRYFGDLESNHGIVCDLPQMLWYQGKCLAGAGRNAVFGQYPSTLSEAWNAPVEGAIYGDIITSLRQKGRIKEFEPHPDLPVFTFWDIGMSDETCIWLVQPAGQEVLWIDWLAESGNPASHYAQRMREWEGKYNMKIACHFLPHDGNRREWGSGMTPVEGLVRAGIPKNAVQFIPRTSDPWDGINRLREILPRSVFHTNCDRARMVRGEESPSALNRLEAYHTKVTEFANVQQLKPVHDGNSHIADAARTFAEAEIKGVLQNGNWGWGGRDVKTVKRKPAITGPVFLRRQQ